LPRFQNGSTTKQKRFSTQRHSYRGDRDGWQSWSCHAFHAASMHHYRSVFLTCLRGALPPVDFRAVCFVRAMVDDVAAKLAFFVRGLFAFFNCENYGSSGRMKQDEG
jgi:hypothetical protein